jgi:NAD(P)-dependent dehydrogenase (short-subunit alcohol dehydrogenase family)
MCIAVVFGVTDPAIAGTTALVTGSSSGIGRAIALRLAEQGASVLCCDLEPIPTAIAEFQAKDVLPTHESIQSNGGVAQYQPLDAADESSIVEAFGHVSDLDGSFKSCVLCAGIFRGGVSLLDDTADNYDAMNLVNARGVWLGCREAGRRFVADKTMGRIVCIASISGLVGLANEAAYAASKGAVVALVRAAARDLSSHSITVNAVAPGLVRTPMTREVFQDEAELAEFAGRTPLQRYGVPEDVADGVMFLLSDSASWITGVTLPIDGGYSNA